MKKKFLSLFIMATMLVGAITICNITTATATNYPDDNETYTNGFATDGSYQQPALENGVYQIANAGELYWFAGLVNGTLSGVKRDVTASAVLTADIDLNPGYAFAYTDGALVVTYENNIVTDTSGLNAWTPIGSSNSYKYTGSFDGNGHTVFGLYINDITATDKGLFGITDGATIENVTLDNSFISAAYRVGSICGWARGATAITDCTNNSIVIAYTYSSKNGTRVGGIAGSIEGSTAISNCVNSGTVTNVGSTAHTGGIVGYADSGTSIQKCTNKSAVVSSASNTGGVVGYVNDATVSECTNESTGTVTSSAETSRSGGICGYVYGGTVSNCTNEAIIMDTNSGRYLGGIVGRASNSSTISECKNTGSVNGASGIGGIFGEVEIATVTGCVNSGNIAGTSSAIGGIFGYATSGGAVIESCTNYGDISGYAYVGGIGGNASGTSTDPFSASDNINTGNITSDRTYVGGIFGSLDGYASVINCVNSGNVTGGSYAGGIAGTLGTNCTLSYSCNLGDVTATGMVSTSTMSIYLGGVAGGGFGTISHCYSYASNLTTIEGSTVYVGGVSGGVSGGEASTVTDCYYLFTGYTGAIGSKDGTSADDEENNVLAKTAAQFASGEVAYLLNDSQDANDGTESSPVTLYWYQNVDCELAEGASYDDYPLLTSASAVVYDIKVTECDGVTVSYIYSNTDSAEVYKDHNYEMVVTDPTCTEKGYTAYTCTVCGDSYIVEETAATGHTTEIQNAKDATCTEDGYTGDEVCTICGETITVGEVIPATGHTTEIKNAKAVTCTEDGYTGDEVCTVCGETITAGEVIPATGHTTEIQNAKDATCTEDGYTGDEVCTVCGETITTGEVIPATGHTLKYVVSATDENVLVETCANCDHDATATITAVDAVYTGETIETASVFYSDSWLGGELEIVYTDNVNAGTATASITAGENAEITAYVTFVISKASQNAPAVATDENPDGISVTDETLDGKADGTITGVTADMEYRAEGEDEYTAVTGETIENLADGTYYIRYAGDENHEPSAEVAVTLGSGEKLVVTFIVDGETYTTCQVSWGASLTADEFPAIPAKTGYDQTAPTWNPESLADITEDTTVTAVYTINTYTVTVPEEQTGYTLTVDTSAAEWGGDVTLTFELAEGYTEAEDFAVMVNGASIELVDGKYTIQAVAADVVITVSGIEKKVEESTTEEPTTETSTSEEEPNTTAEQAEATATDAGITETTANSGSSLKTADTDMVYVWIAILLSASMITVFLAKKRVQE